MSGLPCWAWAIAPGGLCLLFVVSQVILSMMDLVIAIAEVSNAIDRQTDALRERSYIRMVQWEEVDQ